MRVKFETFFKTLLVALAALLVFAVWAGAQTNSGKAAALSTLTNTNAVVTNALASSATVATNNATAAMDKTIAGTDVPLTFWLDRVEILQHQVFTVPLWQYLASLIYIFLAFYVSKFIDYFIRARLKVWASKTKTKLDDLFIDLVHGPVKVVSFVIFLHIGLDVFHWPVWVANSISKTLKVVVAVSLTYMVLKFVDLIMGYWMEHVTKHEDHAFDQQLIPIIRKSLKVFVSVVAVLVTLPALGIDITALIASVSIGGLAIGLAAQDTLSNLFGAVAIFLDKPFRIGDRIQLDSIDGVVETIGLRSTRIRNLDGHLITVPNKTMGNASITNVTRRPNIRTLVNIGVTYDTPAAKVQRAIDLLNEIFKGHANTQDVWVSFNKFADSSLNIFIVHWWNNTDYRAYLQGMQDINLTIKQRFDAEGISFAFPSQTLYVKQDSEWRFTPEMTVPPKE